MNKIKEQLSAFVDDELDQQELSLLLKRLQSDKDLSQSLQRYHAVGHILRHQSPYPMDLADKVRKAIEDEPIQMVHKDEVKHNKISVFEKIAGFAVAASVATIAVLVVKTQPTVPDNTQIAQTKGTFWQSQGPILESRLNTYLVKHNQTIVPAFRGPSNVRLVGYDSGSNQE